MINDKENNFYKSTQISTPFKIFLILLVIAGVIFLDYLFLKNGKSFSDVVGLTISVIGGSTLLYWFFLTSIRKLRNTEYLTDMERSHVNDLSQLKITEKVKKHVFSNMDITDCLNLTVVMGGSFKWMFFYIFAGGTIVVFLCKNNTSLDRILILSLAVVWCPLIEDLILKRVDFKIIFFIKLILTALIFLVGIFSQR